ncbi:MULTISPECIES: HAMP domain-containing sensor histidine kinase [unclassified Colwellia]|uniref:sensor histidine kinase n=1 Tax=unclassified Colwellia TaxID=196834 RepID=UPI0015F62F11|nr:MULTISPECIES: HAMP domain-containing sensor histidine kinase [unclassified Colwellia]MBA6364154.1 sensor histidine kinase [Colwellia sp. BRX8-8]MBA6347617.1 sensor histidine kinase [Colwellia sp. BRX8-9]MBA6351613.1 sensor histidine kinase [Colwellia sp. BRX9-1]MBA6356566.1 sensor histidine kinase [Colwellia sp. BRX8-3]MBA6359352.1 sensor histidine kinase [Colwellia sp. BRX8-6]
MKVTSISRKLLTRVLSVYFVLTFIVTCVQIGAEYINTKSHINSELLTLEKTFSSSLTRAVWELNTQQAVDIAVGLVAIPMIKGIVVTDENDQIIAQLGEFSEGELFNQPDKVTLNSESTAISSFSEGLFGHSFQLIFEFSGRTTKVGTVVLLSSNEVIFDRIEVGIYFLIGNAMVKTAALVILFSLAFSSLLTNPLNELTEQINHFDIDDPEASKLHTMNYENNELNILQRAYNNLLDELVQYQNRLSTAKQEILMANHKLDDQNLILEQEVAKKTSSLSTTMLEMNKQQRELIEQQKQLKAENIRRSQTEQTLTKTNQELKNSILELKKAQERLLDAEKMAILGKLSAEISHEINTPIGVSITSTSYLSDLLNSLKNDVDNQKLTKRSLDDFTKNADQSLHLLFNNLNRASDLITSYKQVAVDQTSNKTRKINVAQYLNEIIQSLQPKLKKTKHTVNVNCVDNIDIYCHAGAISQIFTNLIINSIIHGFDGIENGMITISAKLKGERLHLHYQDNGVGVPQNKLPQIFDPFYTTKSGTGGTGLGTHIINELVTDTLNGTIVAHSEVGQGLSYDIEFNDMR